MKRLFSDIDNTLIYSHKHDIGEDKILVELRNGEKQAYMTRKTYEFLSSLRQRADFSLIPVTSRSKEQFERIFGLTGLLPEPKYAIIMSGGILLVDGKEDYAWTQETKEYIADALPEIEAAEDLMVADRDCGKMWNPYHFMVFCESTNPSAVVSRLEESIDISRVIVYQDERKVYVQPKRMNKGLAVERFVRRFGATATIGAGDFALTDSPMLNAVNYAIIPFDFKDYLHSRHVMRAPKDVLLSDYLCDTLSELDKEIG